MAEDWLVIYHNGRDYVARVFNFRNAPPAWPHSATHAGIAPDCQRIIAIVPLTTGNDGHPTVYLDNGNGLEEAGL